MKEKECDPICKKIGVLISNRRVELRMTLQELADKIGLSKGAIFNYEEGTRDMPISNLVKLSQSLGLDLSTLTSVEELSKVERPKKSIKTFVIHGLSINAETQVQAKKNFNRAISNLIKKL